MASLGAVTAQPYAYVVNSTTNTVTIIDTSTATVRGPVVVGLSPSRVAVSPDSTRAYVTNSGSSSISVVDPAAMSVIRILPTGASPTSIAVTPDGQRIYAATSGGLQVIDAVSGTVITTIPGITQGDIAFTPDGSRAYVAAGNLTMVDTATHAVTTTAINTAGSLAIAPNGLRLYATTTGADIFGSGGAVQIVDTATNTVTGNIALGALPGSLGLAPDGSRIYVGIQAFWADTGYGAAFMPGRIVMVYDTANPSSSAAIDLGAAGANWSLQNTAGRIAVTPNRADVYVLVPRINSVAVASVNTNRVRLNIPVASGLVGLAIGKDSSAVLVPYLIDAADDINAVAVPNTGGINAIANVLANDTLGGLRANVTSVTLTQVSSTTSGVTLNAATGAIVVGAGAPAGTHSVVYRICETANSANCDQATATVSVRAPYVIDAVNDSATSNPGRTAITSVLANDTLNGLTATTGTVRVTQLSSTNSGIALSAAGAVTIAAGTPAGAHQVGYRICEIASPANCDDAVAMVNVIPFAIDAVDDTGAVTQAGGIAVANVLANDRFAGAVATTARVRLTQVSTSHAGVSLNAVTGAVSVAAATPVGGYSLGYRICEIASPANCDDATVTVNVGAYRIDAVNDSARGSSKVANTPVASVLNNDTLGTARATIANVRLSLVSLTPANSMIRLDLTDGSVDVLGKTSSGLYSLVYRICENANPANCDQATVSLDLSGK